MRHLLLRKIIYKIVEHYKFLNDENLFFFKYHLGLAKEGIDFVTCGVPEGYTYDEWKMKSEEEQKEILERCDLYE